MKDNQRSKSIRRRKQTKKRTVHIHNGQVRARHDHALAHDEAQAPGAAGDDADLALEGEGGQGGVDVHAGAAGAGDGLGAGHLVVRRVLDGDTVVRTGKGPGVRGLVLVLVAGLVPGAGLLDVAAGGGAGAGGACGEEGGGAGRSGRGCWAAADGSESCGGGSVERHCGVTVVGWCVSFRCL